MKLLDNYSPLDLLKRPLTVFNYEVNRMRWQPELPDPRKKDMARVWEVLRWLIALSILSFPLVSAFGTMISVLIIGIIVLGPWVASVIADLYTVSNAVMFWRTRAQIETLDVLRLTMPNDEAMLDSLRGATELMAWRGMRWETALRAFLPLCGFVACAAGGIALVASLGQTGSPREMVRFVLGLCLIAWLVRLFFVYVREPLWRMRTLVAMSILIASRTQDTNSGILVASGIAMLLKVVQLTVYVFLIIGTVSLFGFDRWDRELESAVWLGAGCLVVPGSVRIAYQRLHRWFTRETIRVMQGAEHG